MKSKRKKAKTEKRLERAQVISMAVEKRVWLVHGLIPSFVALVAIIVFLPAVQNGFLNWDDDKNFLLNPHYRGLGLAQLKWMFTTFHMGHYIPLTWLTLGLDYLLWGMEPAGYHLTNLLLHAAAAVAFYFLALRLLRLGVGSTGEDSAVRVGAAFAALLFAVHPLRVESVAWVTERRDVLSGFFYVLTIVAYLRATDQVERGARWYWVSVALFVCALLSKSMVVSLPVVLLILDVYPSRRLGGPVGWWSAGARRVYVEKVPFVLLSGVASMVAFIALSHSAAMLSLDKVSPLGRLVISLYGLGFYLWKALLPLNLSPIYELPLKLNLWSAIFILSYVLVLIFTVLAFALYRRLPGLMAAWLGYVVILLPVIGIVQNGPQMTADRYTYLSCLGWAILAGAGIFYCWRLWVRGRLGLQTFILANGLAAVVVAGLGGLTWKQTQVWHDSESLWRHAVAVTSKSSIAHNSLGTALYKGGQVDEAIEHFRQAVWIKPTYVKAHHNLGQLLFARGDFKEAIEHYRQVLRIDPADVDTHNRLGAALFKQGEEVSAIEHFRQALRIDPGFKEAHLNLGAILARRGELEEAIKHYRQALQIDPGLKEAHNNLGNALSKRGEFEEAMKHYREVLRIDPAMAEAHYNMGNSLAKRGELGEAIEHYRQALKVNPSYKEAYNNLGAALFRQGELGEAIEYFRQALRIDPGYKEAERNLGVLLAKQRENR